MPVLRKKGAAETHVYSRLFAQSWAVEQAWLYSDGGLQSTKKFRDVAGVSHRHAIPGPTRHASLRLLEHMSYFGPRSLSKLRRIILDCTVLAGGHLRLQHGIWHVWVADTARVVVDVELADISPPTWL